MRGRWRWLIAAVFVLGPIVGACATLAATRYVPAYRSALAARADLREAQALLRDRRLDASAADLARAERLLADAEHDFRRARTVFDDLPLRLGRRMPLLGGSVTATVRL